MGSVTTSWVFAYNTAPDKTTGLSPFKTCGVYPFTPRDLVLRAIEGKPSVEAEQRAKEI